MKHIVIAIDGPSASGKGTLARNLAEGLSFVYMDTGALYRLIALEAKERHVLPEHNDSIIEITKGIRDKFRLSLLDNPALRLHDIGPMTSKIASIPAVRTILLDIQKRFSRGKYSEEDNSGEKNSCSARGVIMDGRDIGTVVCPDADLKLYVTANSEVRAQRRHTELQQAGDQVEYQVVMDQLIARDERDSGRASAPLKPAEDAVIIDTSVLTQKQVMEKAMGYITPLLKKIDENDGKS